MKLHNLVNHGLKLLSLGAVHHIGMVYPYHGFMGRNLNNIKIVDLHELSGFRGSGSRHPSQFVVHPEVVLEGYGGQGLVFALYLHPLFCLNGLMQTVAPAPSRHETAGKLVNNHNLAVLNNVVHIAFEEGVGLQGLLNVVKHADV